MFLELNRLPGSRYLILIWGLMQYSKFRQGSLLLLPALFASDSSASKQSHLILAQSELTGYQHQITDGQAELYEKNGVLYLQVLSETAMLSHETHQSIEIPRGVWMVQHQREYQPTLRCLQELMESHAYDYG